MGVKRRYCVTLKATPSNLSTLRMVNWKPLLWVTKKETLSTRVCPLAKRQPLVLEVLLSLVVPLLLPPLPLLLESTITARRSPVKEKARTRRRRRKERRRRATRRTRRTRRRRVTRRRRRTRAIKRTRKTRRIRRTRRTRTRRRSKSVECHTYHKY